MISAFLKFRQKLANSGNLFCLSEEMNNPMNMSIAITIWKQRGIHNMVLRSRLFLAAFKFDLNCTFMVILVIL